ncbi:MAG: hypothetical protein ChlgKO_10910 [Chlamydiales bacterium]
MTTITITKEHPPTMWPLEILQGDHIWRATLLSVSTLGYFFFIKNTNYYPLTTNRRIVQFLAVNILVQQAFKIFKIDQYAASFFGSNLDTTIAYLRENDETIQLNTSQKIAAFIIGEDRFRYSLQTKYLNPDTKFEGPHHTQHVKTLCDRLVLRKQILAKKATILKNAERVKSPPTYQKIYQFTGFIFVTIGSIFLLQSTTPYLGTFHRAARYLFSNNIINLIIDTCSGENAPESSRHTLLDFSNFANPNFYSRIQKQRIIDSIFSEISSYKPNSDDYTNEMKAAIEIAETLDQDKKNLREFLAKKIYEDMRDGNARNIPVLINQLILSVPSKAEALRELLEVKDIDRPEELLDPFVTILKSTSPTLLQEPWIKRIFRQLTTSTPSPKIDPENLTIEENTSYKSLQRKIAKKSDELAKKVCALDPSHETKDIEVLKEKLQKAKTMLPVALAKRACVLLKKEPKSEEELLELEDLLAKFNPQNDKEPSLASIEKTLPETGLNKIKETISSSHTISDGYEDLKKVTRNLVKYYPEIQELINIIPEEKPTSGTERAALYSKIKKEKESLEELNYECKSIKECERDIAYYSTLIRQKEEHFSIRKILGQSLSALSIIYQSTPLFNFAKNILPAKEFGWRDKETYLHPAIDFIFNYCVKKL